MIRSLANAIPQPYKLVFILWLAFLLRMNGLTFGLPYVFHDDEHQYVGAGVAFLQNQQAALVGLQKLNNPPLFKSSLGLLYVLYSRLLIHDPQEIQAAANSETWRTFFHYAGRLASVSAGLLTVALLYALGKRLYSPKIGLLGAFLLAVSFLHVRESHFAVNDIPLTFLAVASLYTGAGILRRGRWFDYLATGFLIGLAVATKYTGVYLASILLLAHWLQYPGNANFGRLKWLLSPRWLTALALVPIGFVVGAPVALTAWSEMLRRMARLAEYGRSGYHDLLLAPYGSWIFYLETLAWGVGVLMFGVCLLALLAVLSHRSRKDLLVAVFPVLLYVMMAQQKMVFVRFILPALPPLLLLAAVWLERFSHFIAKLSPKINNRTALTLATTLLILQPLAWSIWFGVILNRTDTRQAVTSWLQENIPAGSAIYAEIHAIPRESVTGRVSWPYVQPKDLPFNAPTPLTYYQERGIQFIITSNYHHKRKFTDLEKETGRQKWLATLSQLELIKEFQPYWLPGQWFSFDQRYGPWQETLLRRQPGPIISIYALDTPPYKHQLNPFDEANQVPDKASVYGYELIPPHNVLPEQTLQVVIYWLNKGWQASDNLVVTITDTAGFKITQAVAKPVPDFAEELNLGHKIIKSEAQLLIPAGTPPGSYRLHFNVYESNKLQTLGTIELAGLTVDEPPPAANTPDRPPETGDLSLAPGISLSSSKLSVTDKAMQNTLAFGQENWLVLLWRADKDINVDYKLQLTLLDPQENVIAAWEGQPVHNNYATSNWQAGQFIRDPWNLKLPETINNLDPKAGDIPYKLILTVLDPKDNIIGLTELGTMFISGHLRSSAIPAMQHSLDAVWAGAFSLLGLNVRAIPDSSNSGWLELDLFWQSLAPLETDYLVGIRLVDASGQTVLAQDGQPNGGQSPISSWQAGEVVHDFHSLRYENLAMADKYRLEIGLINPQTGEFLPTEKGDKTLLLTSWP